MSETRNGGRRPRGRNLPLILLLLVLAVVALSQFTPDASKTAGITFSQWRFLGEEGALQDIEIIHGPERVEIKGKLDEDQLNEILGKLDDGERKVLEGKNRYRVEGILPGAVNNPDIYQDMKGWVARRDRIKESESSQLIPTFLFTIMPWLLIAAFFWFFVFRPMRQAGGSGGVLSFGRSRAKLYTPEMTNVTFDDVAGIHEAKEEVREIIEFLRNPGKFQKLGGRIPRGVILYGPPGCGKTLLAKAIAGEAGVPFFAISGSDFVEMFVGVGASRVRDLFTQAKEKSPCLIFLDEIDAVGRRRGSGLGGGHDEREQTLNQILVEMDGFETDKGIIVVAATNRPDVLDSALLRPGRFDRQVVIDLPDVDGRKAILKVHAEKVKMAPSVDLGIIARGTPGFSGAELEAVINEAAIGAAMGNRQWVTHPDLEEARDKVRWGRSRRSRSNAMTKQELTATAYHEAGHAIAMVLLPDAENLHKVTIIPRGSSLGATLQLPERDRFTWYRKYMLDQITMLYAGRIAEEFYTGDLSSGAANDIKQATELTRQMVTKFGMSELGPIAFGGGNEDTVFLGREITRHQNHSEQTVDRIDKAVEQITRECHTRAEKLLRENQDKVKAVAEALVEYETLTADEVTVVLEGGDVGDFRKKTAEQAPPPEPDPVEDPGPDPLPGLDPDPATA